MKSPFALALVGATATGKSDVALALAGRLNAEIVSVDSMQVYRGLDIGTAKPTPAERARLKHHLIDVVDLAQPFNAATFAHAANAAILDIQRRGHYVILCGGTGLYFKALLEGLTSTPPADPALRATLESTPLRILLDELRLRDPSTFKQIDHRNKRRIVRAIEILRLTGYPPLAQPTARRPSPTPAKNLLLATFGLTRETNDLRLRIESRVDAMFAHGLVTETKELLPLGLATNRTALQAIGYRQVFEYLQGQRSLTDTIALVKQKSRQLARRQMTWFRNQQNVSWIAVSSLEPADVTADRLLARLRPSLTSAAVEAHHTPPALTTDPGPLQKQELPHSPTRAMLYPGDQDRHTPVGRPEETD
jgi:tRNA dimethylallyltransferase